MFGRDERIERQKKLIKDTRYGNEAAFFELKNELHIPVASKLRTWVKNITDFDDLVKATWLKVKEDIGLYDPDRGTPLTFVLSIAEREAGDLFLHGRKGDLYLEDLEAKLRDKSLDVDPEASLSKKEIGERLNKFYIYLLELTFKIGGYPNQILAFMYSKVIFPCAKKKNKRANGYPERVYLELFDERLKELSLQLENKYLRYSFLPESQVTSVFKPLHSEMARLLKDILNEKTDSYTWQTIKKRELLNELAGNTIMRHYCREETDKSYYVGIVTNWCYKVQERVRKGFFGQPEMIKFFFSMVENLGLVSSLTFSSKKFRDIYSKTGVWR